MEPTVYLLVAHGSRDRRPQIALERLAYLVAKDLTNKAIAFPSSRFAFTESRSHRISVATLPRSSELIPVHTAVLECHPLPLHQQISAIAANYPHYKRLKIVPLFLSPGVHVREDLPREVELAQKLLKNNVIVESLPYIGSSPAFSSLFSQSLTSDPESQSILIAHGSRRLGGNLPMENLAHQLGLKVAYWSVPPNLIAVITTLLQQGLTRLQILPYFLFAGGITDGIAAQVEQLQQEYPHVDWQLGQPMGTSPAIAELIAHWSLEALSNE